RKISDTCQGRPSCLPLPTNGSCRSEPMCSPEPTCSPSETIQSPNMSTEACLKIPTEENPNFQTSSTPIVYSLKNGSTHDGRGGRFPASTCARHSSSVIRSPS